MPINQTWHQIQSQQFESSHCHLFIASCNTVRFTARPLDLRGIPSWYSVAAETKSGRGNSRLDGLEKELSRAQKHMRYNAFSTLWRDAKLQEYMLYKDWNQTLNFYYPTRPRNVAKSEPLKALKVHCRLGYFSRTRTGTAQNFRQNNRRSSLRHLGWLHCSHLRGVKMADCP